LIFGHLFSIITTLPQVAWASLFEHRRILMIEQPVSSSTLQNLQEENKRLRRAVEELSIINDLARAISASLDSQEIIGTIVRRSIRAVNAEQGVITLVEEESNDSMKTLVRAMASSADHEQFHLNQTLLGWMHLNKKPLLINDPKNDPRFRGVTWEAATHSLVCVPLMIKSELKGVLTVYNKKGQSEFSEDEQRLLAIIAAQSAQVVENARLNEREKELLKMQEEIRLASRIQSDLLPKSQPALPGYDVSGRTIPAQDIGGDYFDFITINETRCAVCLGDVSGKGLPASLLMANTQATLRGQALMSASPKDCIARANRLLYHSTSPEKFVTLFYAILDTSAHTLQYTNAGHDNPYLMSDGAEPQRLSAGGVPLSMLEEFPFEEGTTPLAPGDVVVICSDGVTEAMNAMQEQFGDTRLAAAIREHLNQSASGIIDGVIGAVKAHAGNTPQMDDITMVVIKRT